MALSTTNAHATCKVTHNPSIMRYDYIYYIYIYIICTYILYMVMPTVMLIILPCIAIQTGVTISDPQTKLHNELMTSDQGQQD